MLRFSQASPDIMTRGRAEADVPGFLSFFCEGMADAFSSVRAHGSRRILSTPKKAPAAGRVAQVRLAASERGCPSRSSYDHAKRPDIYRGRNPASGVLRLGQPRSGVWATRPAVGRYGSAGRRILRFEPWALRSIFQAWTRAK